MPDLNEIVFGLLVRKGGPGSGHHGHKGRPGEVGGSEPGEGGSTAGGAAAVAEPLVGLKPAAPIDVKTATPVDLYIGVQDGTVDYQDAVAELTKRAGGVFVKREGPTSMWEHVAMLAAVVDAPPYAQAALKGPDRWSLTVTGEAGAPINVGGKVFNRVGQANHDTRQITMFSGHQGIYQTTIHELGHASLSHQFSAAGADKDQYRLGLLLNVFTDASIKEGGVSEYAKAYEKETRGVPTGSGKPIGVFTHENFAETLAITHITGFGGSLARKHPETWAAFRKLEGLMNERIKKLKPVIT